MNIYWRSEGSGMWLGRRVTAGVPYWETPKIRRLAFRMVIALFIALRRPGAIPLATPPTGVQTREAHLNFKCFFFCSRWITAVGEERSSRRWPREVCISVRWIQFVYLHADCQEFDRAMCELALRRSLRRGKISKNTFIALGNKSEVAAAANEWGDSEALHIDKLSTVANFCN